MVIMSIHQPGSAIYGLFDTLCLLSKGEMVCEIAVICALRSRGVIINARISLELVCVWLELTRVEPYVVKLFEATIAVRVPG